MHIIFITGITISVFFFTTINTDLQATFYTPHPVLAGVHGVLPERPAEQAWTAALCLGTAAHCGPQVARCGAGLGQERQGPPHLQGCNQEHTCIIIQAWIGTKIVTFTR